MHSETILLVRRVCSLLLVVEGANHIVCSIYHHSLVPEHHSACKLGLLARPNVKFVLHGLLLHYGV
jgi:hypothetical protein